MKKAAVLLLFMLGGCEAVVPQTTANYKLSKSQEDLRACLKANPDNAKACESQRQIYEMDLASYRAAMSGGSPALIPYYNSPPPGSY